MTILGLASLVPAMAGVVFVITDLMFGSVGAVVVSLVMAAWFAGLWFALPLLYRRNGGYWSRSSTPGARPGSVTAPSDAEETSAAYFAMTPVE